MNTEQIEAQRVLFEAHIRADNADVGDEEYVHLILLRNELGGYNTVRIAEGFACWLASATASEGRIAELEHALRFYAREETYWGPNQKPDGTDPYTEKDAAYRQDITRDGGNIACAALAGSATPSAEVELTPLDYRAQGREEALAIILAQEPEDPFTECTNTSANGDCGDYSTHWDEDALRELLHIGDRKHDAYDRAEAAYYDAIGMKESAQWEMTLVKRAPFYEPLTEFLSKHKAFDLMASLKRPSDDQPVVQQDTLKNADSERIDWATKNLIREASMRFPDGSFKPVNAWSIASAGTNLREAIDAAIANQEGGV